MHETLAISRSGPGDARTLVLDAAVCLPGLSHQLRSRIDHAWARNMTTEAVGQSSALSCRERQPRVDVEVPRS